MPGLPIPPAIDEILSAASHHSGLSPSLSAGLASIARSVMRAYAGADVDVSQLVRALGKIGKVIAAGGKEDLSDADAAACEDLAALARQLGRVVDGSIAPGGTGVAPVPIAIDSFEPSEPAPAEQEASREPRPFTGDVAAEHLDEAGLCRTRWDVALCAPNYTAAEVQEGPEERLRAHLDALVLGGRPVAEQVLVPALDHEDPPTAFAAAWCLLASKEGDFDDAGVSAFASAAEPRRRELARARPWLRRTRPAIAWCKRFPACHRRRAPRRRGR